MGLKGFQTRMEIRLSLLHTRAHARNKLQLIKLIPLQHRRVLIQIHLNQRKKNSLGVRTD